VRVGTDYVVSVYFPPPHTIHPPHPIPRILEESVIVFRRLRIHYNNIVSSQYSIIHSELQFYDFNISAEDTPMALAFEVEAPLVEWAEKSVCQFLQPSKTPWSNIQSWHVSLTYGA